MKWIPISQTITVNVTQLSQIINCIGSNDFDQAMLDIVNIVAPVLEVSGFVFNSDAEPFVAGWTGVRADAAVRAERYVHRYHHYDPVFKNLPDDATPGNIYAQTLHIRSVNHEGYRWLFFEEPNFRSEMSIVRRTELGWDIMKYYLEEDYLLPRTVIQLGELTALLIPIAERHTLNSEGRIRKESRPRAQERLISRLGNRFPTLTPRERQVCAQTILGASAQMIAETLDISPNTVMTYRRRAYKRLGVSSANELVKELI
jgi:DNA-binding CsgD family transcriptional regulator